MEKEHAKEPKLRRGFMITSIVGSLALTTALVGVKTYDYLRDNGTVEPVGWHYGHGVEIIDASCNDLVDGLYCSPGSTYKMRYRQCRDDNFPEDNHGYAPVQTPRGCVDWTVSDVLASGLSDPPILYPNNEDYPKATGLQDYGV